MGSKLGTKTKSGLKMKAGLHFKIQSLSCGNSHKLPLIPMEHFPR